MKFVKERSAQNYIKFVLPYKILGIFLFERKKFLPTLDFLLILTFLILSDDVVYESITVDWFLILS